MPDLLVRDIDPEVYKRMKKAAADQGKSLAQTAREALANTFKISRDEVWAEIDRFRERIGRTKGSSLEDIREMRDRDVSGR
jgi:plasmid stability protein